jgi:hypothetical protein
MKEGEEKEKEEDEEEDEEEGKQHPKPWGPALLFKGTRQINSAATTLLVVPVIHVVVVTSKTLEGPDA